MSLATFFKVATGQYSDDQIRAAAAAYYGRTASSAAVAAVNNDITVNVNIDGETVKQFKPEQPKQPEKKPEPEPPKQPEKQPEKKPEPEPPKQPEKQPEKKPESSKATPPKQPEPEPPKQPEKQPEKKPESTKATPPKQPEQPKTEQSEQPEKKPESEKKQPKNKPELGQQPKQDVAEQQAAHPVNGFNIAAFTQPQPSATQQVARMPMPTTQPPAVTTIPLLPVEYNNMSPSEKCDVLFDLAVCGVLPPFVNPRAGYTNQQKLTELKKNFTFLHIEGRSISTLQLDMLYGLLESPRLKSAMNRYDAVDRANNPKLTEVPVATYATGEQTKKYDMCFEVKLKDPAKKLVVLYSTVPAFSMATVTWGQELELFVK